MVANLNFKPVAYFGMLAFLILLKEVVFSRCSLLPVRSWNSLFVLSTIYAIVCAICGVGWGSESPDQCFVQTLKTVLICSLVATIS